MEIGLSSDAAGQAFDFDLPAQPLAAALDRYAAISRRPALFRSELVAGRSSSAVRGRYAPDVALSLLLKGTGLMADRSDAAPADGFVLMEAGQISAPAIAPAIYDGINGLVSNQQYPGQVQARIWKTLCSRALTAPEGYRSLLRFQLSAAGRLEQVRLLHGTGDARRDAAVLASLQAVHVDTPPPELAQQTLTMLILPRDQGGPRCNGDAS